MTIRAVQVNTNWYKLVQISTDQYLLSQKKKHWRESGKLPWGKDSLTGSTDPECIEWLVPITWERMSEGDFQKVKLAKITTASMKTKQNYWVLHLDALKPTPTRTETSR